MKKSIIKLLTVVTFGLMLSSSAMASDEVDALTLSFQNNSVSTASAHISKASYTPRVVATNSVLDICYDSSK